MATNIQESLKAFFKLDTSDVSKGMKKATSDVSKGSKKMEGNMGALAKKVGSVAAAMGLMATGTKVAKFIFDINKETEKFHASLETVTGSSEKATKGLPKPRTSSTDNGVASATLRRVWVTRSETIKWITRRTVSNTC